MAIRLWPQDYERKEHITKAEKQLLKNASRNFKNGHIAVEIDPVGLSTSAIRMGMYISPKEGLVTFSIYPGSIQSYSVEACKTYVDIVEDKIYSRLLDSKILIVRCENYKMLKFPYKHVVMFPEERVGNTTIAPEQINRLLNYATFDFFRPIASDGNERTVKELKIFDGVRKPYDKAFTEITELECRAIFERLAPEYTVVMNESEHIQVQESTQKVSEQDFFITGKELEFKTFFLDEYQVSIVNDMGTGHRVLLANPGAGKSVILLSKAFKYASLFKDSKVLLTCYNNNLADAYDFKRRCANFMNDRGLYVMTFHKLVKKIYEEVLHSKTESNIANENEIRKCIEYVRSGKVQIRFKAIFIDEVQNFDPLFLELCYCLLEPGDQSTFLMAGDLNQAVRAQSRRGDVPWKRINGVKLDFSGRVKYIEKNYRNGREIGEYIYSMLIHMNRRLSMLGMINSMEYEYNSFTMSDKPAVALEVRAGITRDKIVSTVLSSLKEIIEKYRVSYSDIAILFPYRQNKSLHYYFLSNLVKALDEAAIPYSMIISSNDSTGRARYSDTSGVVLSTIESSLGLDFKAVILAGLYPYSYVFTKKGAQGIDSWTSIKNMYDEYQNIVQSQMRAIYTACSRARDILYVLSDLKRNTPMEELVLKGGGVSNHKTENNRASVYGSEVSERRQVKAELNDVEVLQQVVDHVRTGVI